MPTEGNVSEICAPFNKLPLSFFSPFQLIPYWEEKFGIDLSRPHIGVVNVTDVSRKWISLKTSAQLPYFILIDDGAILQANS